MTPSATPPSSVSRWGLTMRILDAFFGRWSNRRRRTPPSPVSSPRWGRGGGPTCGGNPLPTLPRTRGRCRTNLRRPNTYPRPSAGEGGRRPGEGCRRQHQPSPKLIRIDSKTASISRIASLFQNLKTVIPKEFKYFVRALSYSTFSICCEPSSSIAKFFSRQ